MPPLSPSSSPSTPPLASATASKAGMRRRGGGSAAAATASSPDINTMASGDLPLLLRQQQKRLERLAEALAGSSRAVAPIAIIGGTVSVYSSAIRQSNNADLTPTSILYLLLLALNYAVMPRLSKKHIYPRTNKQSTALAEEVVKMSMGVGGWILSGYATASANSAEQRAMDASTPIATVEVLSQQLRDWSPSSALIAAGLPSALYALQGTLTYTAYQNLDAVTFNGLTQLKVLSSALCCYVVLGKRQSGVQLFALGLLMVSTAIFQGRWRLWLGGPPREKGDGTGTDNHRRLLLGVLPCIGATLLSGLAGAFSQRSLQTQVGDMKRNAYFYTVEVSFLSAVCLAFSMGMDRWRHGTGSASAAGGTERNGFFEHWTYATLLPVTTKAAAGLLTALVHRHLGSVVKGFALVLGLVFSALLQFVLEGVDLTIGQLAGTALVLLSSWLHFTNAPVA